MEYKNKTITIIGAAKSGIAAANLILEVGGQPKITDEKSLVELDNALSALKDRRRIAIETDKHTKEFLLASDAVVVSPGVSYDAQPLQWVREQGIPVLGEIEFAWQFCRKPVIAITGSNGKTTTATLVTKVLEAAGKNAQLCGNIGTPFSHCVLSTEVDFFVIEISSFQLELIDTFRPHIAVILNFSQNHLDRHADMQEYFNAKKRILKNLMPSDYAVLNYKDLLLRPLAKEVRSQVRFFNKEEGDRNTNQLAVLEIARIIGIPDKVSFKVFDEFGGVEHRLERVRILEGVEYINDSKATTVESGRWALTRVPGPIILICGGGDKNLEYESLRHLVKEKVKKLIVLTREELSRQKLHRAFDGIVPIEDHTDMPEALHSVRLQAKSGDKVLLSPMFTSFDMFNNFDERGSFFKKTVNDLS